MTIEEGLKHKGRPFNIPDCSRDDLPKFFKDRGCKVGVEIGVFEANYTIKLAESEATIYGVDPWVNYYRHTDYAAWLEIIEQSFNKKIQEFI